MQRLFWSATGTHPARKEERFSPEADSWERPGFGGKKAALQSGQVLSLEPSPAPSRPRRARPAGTWGCRSGAPAMCSGVANKPGCNGAVALMHSACVVSPPLQPVIYT